MDPSAWEGLRQRASQMSGIVAKLPDFLKSLIERLFQSARRAWDGIQNLWNALQQRFSGMWDRVQAGAKAAWNAARERATSVWTSIGTAWTQVQAKAGAQMQRLLGMAGQVWNGVTGAAIAPIVEQLVKWAPMVKWLLMAIRDPEGALRPTVVAIANKLQGEVPGQLPEVMGAQVGAAGGPATRSTGGGVSTTAGAPVSRHIDRSALVQRDAAAPAADAPRTATWGELFKGVWFAISHQWEQLGLLGLVKGAVDAVIHPWDTMTKEWGEMDKELNASFDRIFAQFSFSSLQKAWASVLRVLDLGFIAWRHLNNILLVIYPWAALVMILGGALFEGIGAAAGAALAWQVGEVLLGSFLLAEGATVVRAAAELLTVPQTPEQQEVDYTQAAGSVIALTVAGVLWAASGLAGMVGKYLGIGARLAKIPSVARFLEDFRKAKAGLKGEGGAPDTKAPVDDPTPAKAKPNEVVICRMCFKVKDVPQDILAERTNLSEPMKQALDNKLNRLIRDPENPTAVEFDRLRGIMDSMKKRFGSVEAALQDEVNRANPTAKPPFGPGAAELPRLRTAAKDLLARIQEFAKANPDKAQGILRGAARLEADMNGVLSDMETGKTEATQARIEGFDNNLKGVDNEFAKNQAAPSGTQFGEKKKVDGKKIEIDQISPDGSRWINDKSFNLFGADDPRVGDLTAQAELTIKAAQAPENLVGGKAPAVEFRFSKGVTPEVAAKLRAVQVNGQHLIVTGTEIPLKR